MRRRASARTSTSSTWARAGTPRSRSRACRAACSTITTPARSRRRASRRTCGCSGCSATSPRSSRRARKKVLVIGCGAGVTAGAVSIDPTVEHETIAEIEPLVPKVVSTYFAEHNFNVVTQPEGARPARRRAALPDDDEREVRRDHVGPARPVGQGRGDALHARVLRDRQGAPQSRRRRHAVRAAVREQHGGGEERDRDVHRSVPERRRLGQHAGRPRLRPRADGHGRAPADQRRRDPGEAGPAPSTRRWRSRSAKSASTRRSICSPPTPGAARTSSLADGRDHQPRPQPQAAVPRRPRPEPVSERPHLLRHAHAREVSDGLFTGSPATMQTLRDAIARAQGRGMAP